MAPAPGAAPGPLSLRGVVHRAHLGMALVAMALAGSLLLLAGLFALRTHIGSNLELTARAVAYTVEAALVFRDAEDAQQTLARMLASEGGGGRRRARCSRSGSAARRGRVRAWVPRWRGWSAASRLWPPSCLAAWRWGRSRCMATGRAC